MLNGSVDVNKLSQPSSNINKGLDNWGEIHKYFNSAFIVFGLHIFNKKYLMKYNTLVNFSLFGSERQKCSTNIWFTLAPKFSISTDILTSEYDTPKTHKC